MLQKDMVNNRIWCFSHAIKPLWSVLQIIMEDCFIVGGIFSYCDEAACFSDNLFIGFSKDVMFLSVCC